jgi:sulfhydrogenase subunit gamma (sulfur reductase)
MTTSLLETLQEPSIYLPAMATIKEVRQISERDKLFKLELPGGLSLNHQPGQFVEVSVLGVGEAPISITSSPSRSNGDFEICVRRLGDLTSVLHRMGPGDKLGVRGPFGRGFPYMRFRGKDLLFALGGLGLPPGRSLINQVLDERPLYGRVIILSGARNPSELLFMDEVAQWQARGDIEVHVTVDRADETWKGNVGVVTTLFPKIDIHPRNTVGLTIGPPAMYRFVLMEFQAKGISEGSIYLSLERRMKCGVGKCGHCQINNIYTCQSGPVFSYAEIKPLEEAL